MYDVIVAVKSKGLFQELQRMHVWGDTTGFRISQTVSDFEHLLPELQKRKYDLLLLENLPDNHTISLLRSIKKDNLCRSVAIVCEYVDFNTVRKSFLLGVDDYFVTPLESNQFITLFSKIENADHGKIAAEICKKEELLNLFESADFSLRERLDELQYRIFSEDADMAEEAAYVRRILDGVILDLFEKHEWMEYYFAREDYMNGGIDNIEDGDGIRKSIEDFYSLFTEFAELYPRHGHGLEEILVYILKRPEGDLKQKTIAEEMYINRSYLSTVFTAQLEVSFVDYINNVKLKRAAYLLKHTKMKVIDITGVLDYKDMGYFLKRFKAKYGVTPSQYRIPEAYEFQI